MLCLACADAARIVFSDTRSSTNSRSLSFPVGYNPINGEAYSGGKSADSAKPAESDSAPVQVAAETIAEPKDNSNADQTSNGNNAQKVRLNPVEWTEKE